MVVGRRGQEVGEAPARGREGKEADDRGRKENRPDDGLGVGRAGALAAGAGLVFNLYNQLHWYDEVVHAYNFFVLTLLAPAYAYGAVLTGAREPGFLPVLTVTVFGLGLEALWEIREFAYDHFVVKPNVILPKRDTIIDMALDMAGVLAAGLIRLGMLRK